MSLQHSKTRQGSAESLRIYTHLELRTNGNYERDQSKYRRPLWTKKETKNGISGHPFTIQVEEATSKTLPITPSVTTTVIQDSPSLDIVELGKKKKKKKREKKKKPFSLFSFFRRVDEKSRKKVPVDQPQVFNTLSHPLQVNRDCQKVGLNIFHHISKPANKHNKDIALEYDLQKETERYEHSYRRHCDDFTSIEFDLDSCDYSPDQVLNPITQHHTLPYLGSHHQVNDQMPPGANCRLPKLSIPTIMHSSQSLPPIGERPSLLLENTSNNNISDLEAWMSCLSEELKRIPLNHLLIPGSHDSFSFSLAAEEQIGPDAPEVVASLDSCCPCLARPAILRWSVTQKASVTAQLEHGVRYFDIRVAVRNSRFYFVHGLFGDDLQPLLCEIQHFLVRYPGEVVLLDFQHFHGLSRSDHHALISLLENIFQDLLCPAFDQLRHLTLAYLARLKYQVLVFYRHQEFMQLVEWLWPSESIPNPWPHTTSVTKMIAFLEKKLQGRNPHTFFVTQCILTPSGKYLLRKVAGMLEKDMAAPCNKVVETWVGHLPRGPQGPNIVMTDFVEQDDWSIPRAVIKKNSTLVIPPTPLNRY